MICGITSCAPSLITRQPASQTFAIYPTFNTVTKSFSLVLHTQVADLQGGGREGDGQWHPLSTVIFIVDVMAPKDAETKSVS